MYIKKKKGRRKIGKFKKKKLSKLKSSNLLHWNKRKIGQFLRRAMFFFSASETRKF